MPVKRLNQYVVVISTNDELPPDHKLIEYHGERFGVLPKRGCNDCNGSGAIIRDGQESNCDCLWRRMFDARRSQPASSRVFITNSPGMVTELRKRQAVLQKQVEQAHNGVTGTQVNMDEELRRHDDVIEQARQEEESAAEKHRTVQANIEHLEKTIEYNKGRADELRAQARELENQAERNRVELGKLRSHELHQTNLERERQHKRVERLLEDHNQISHRWHKQLRDPQRELRRAEERLAKINRQIEHLSVEDLETATTAPTTPLEVITAPKPVLVVPSAAESLAAHRSATLAARVETSAPIVAPPVLAPPQSEPPAVTLDSLITPPVREIEPPAEPTPTATAAPVVVPAAVVGAAETATK